MTLANPDSAVGAPTPVPTASFLGRKTTAQGYLGPLGQQN